MTIAAKQEHIDTNVPQDMYQLFCRAADLTGATVNQFLVQSALKEARAVIEREEIIKLSARDWSWMLDLIENPPEPNQKMTAAIKNYQALKHDDSDTRFNWQP